MEVDDHVEPVVEESCFLSTAHPSVMGSRFFEADCSLPAAATLLESIPRQAGGPPVSF